jgi:membrane protein DedA with SNARE-associated domain
MSEKIITLLVHFVTSVIDSGGYVGIAVLMGIESACIPLPSEIIMPFAGFLVYPANPQGHFSLFWVATAGAIGCNVGSLVAYWIGALGGRPLVERYGKWVLMSHRDLDMMTSFFNRYGSITVLVARLLPVVRTFIAFPAGIAKMPQWRFHIYTFIGSWPWCYALAYVGMKLGEKWHTDPRFHAVFERFHLVVEVALLAAVVWFIWTHLRRVRDRNAASGHDLG